MDVSLQDLRAFAVRNRLEVTFHVRSTNAAWTVNRRGLVTHPALGDSGVSGVEVTLETADEFVVEGDKAPQQRLSREQFIALLADRAAAAGAGRSPDDE